MRDAARPVGSRSPESVATGGPAIDQFRCRVGFFGDAASRRSAADAASQSLTRFFRNEQLTEGQVACVLEGLSPLAELLALDHVANASVTPESLAAELLPKLPCGAADDQPAVGAI